MPNRHDVRQCQQGVYKRRPRLCHVYTVAHDLQVHLEDADNEIRLKKHYNGWKHDYFFGGVYGFSAKGLNLECVLNAPGSMHDSTFSDRGVFSMPN